MIYVVAETHSIFALGRPYKLFETNTESFFSANESEMKLLLTETEIRNACLTDNEIMIKQWCNKIQSEVVVPDKRSEYILLCKLEDAIFKLVGPTDNVVHMNSEKLIKYIRRNKVANCIVKNGEYKSMDTYNVSRSIQFEKQIAEKYERYVNISAALGYKMIFDYTVEGKEVKLKRYTGTAKKIIIPNFITSIMHSAFKGCKIAELTLNKGLKAIGSFAFEECGLVDLVIPETVQFIGLKAFYNERQSKNNNLKILNNNTVDLDNIIRVVW